MLANSQRRLACAQRDQKVLCCVVKKRVNLLRGEYRSEYVRRMLENIANLSVLHQLKALEQRQHVVRSARSVVPDDRCCDLYSRLEAQFVEDVGDVIGNRASR